MEEDTCPDRTATPLEEKRVGSVSVIAAEGESPKPATIDTGDAVKHNPTGEEWVVAFVEGDRLAWLGYPEGVANLSDCALVEKASPGKRVYWLRAMAKSRGTRAEYAKATLAAEGIPISDPDDEDDDLGDVELGPACVLGDTECASCQ